MRTTLTLDDDLEHLIRERAEKSKQSFKAIVNEALRLGLAKLAEPRTRKATYRTKGVTLGARLPNLDNIADILELTEGRERK